MEGVKRQICLPKEFIERMKKLLGTEQEAFFNSYQKEALRGLRLNLLKGSKEEFLKKNTFSLTPVLWEPNGFSYLAEEHPGKHPYHEAGVYYIQEPSAMAVAALTAPCPGEKILDLCAAPGGKTSHLASQMKGQGLLVANEIHLARAKILSQNVERMGIRNAVVTNEEPKVLVEYFPEFFDRIVVDAPCSGEGMFRKEEAACLEWSVQNVGLCAIRQQEILTCAAKMLKPGGRLVYSTCTFAPEENEGTVSLFLEKHPEFKIDLEVDYEKYYQMGFSYGYSEWIKEGTEMVTAAVRNTFRLFPHRIKGEGHYIAVLCKSGNHDWKRDKDHKSDKDELDKQVYFEKKIYGKGKAEKYKKETQEFINRLAYWEIFQKELGLSFCQGKYQFFGNELYLVPEEMVDMKGLKVLRAGLHLGILKKNRFEPSHSLALALSPADLSNVVSFEKDSKEILSYLKGEMIFLKEKGKKGWNLVCVDGYSIGWGKVGQNEMKNHYPKGLRWT